MDYGTNDARVSAEKGFFLQLKDPITRKPNASDDGEPSGFWLRGASAPTSQRNLGELYLKNERMQEAQEMLDAAIASGDEERIAVARKRKAEEDSDGNVALEAAHQRAVETAMAYISHGVNMFYGGEPVEHNKDLIRKVLNSSFPLFTYSTEKGSEGQLKQYNEPYTKQVIRAAEEYGTFLDESQPS